MKYQQLLKTIVLTGAALIVVIVVAAGGWLFLEIRKDLASDKSLDPIAIRFRPETPEIVSIDYYETRSDRRNGLVLTSRVPVTLKVRFKDGPIETYIVHPPSWFDDGAAYTIRKGQEPVNNGGSGHIERVK